MPELPEVEIIVRGLRRAISGKTIEELEVRTPRMVWLDEVRATGNVEVGQIKQLVDRHTVTDVKRRAKMIVVSLSGDTTILIHLKMTGQLIYVDGNNRVAGGHPSLDMVGNLPVKATHVIFHFSDHTTLYFNDVRKFGYAKIISSQSLADHATYRQYGPEPLEEAFDVAYVQAMARRRAKITVKQFIMDQSIVAGIGNIYADETLFEAQIHPSRAMKTLTVEEIIALVKDIKVILLRGLDHGGTSQKDYVQVDGSRGSMQDHLMVYRKTGEPCPRCGTPIERTVIGGRGTHFCPTCQQKL